ncbi:MAG: hypothetical protein HWN65_02170 [Candidatus Helarchaeota archaeon]|nr:hypothetical protein [Candidatus Helarchaeota archaeon]
MTIEKLKAIKEFSNVRQILIDKNLAKLGDPFVNFIYSLAKSYVLGKYDSWKVPDKVLAQALRDAEMRNLVSQKASTHDLGDAVEALLIHEWLFQKISIDELVTILSTHLQSGDFSDKKKESRAALQAFTAVLLTTREGFEK